MKTTIDGAGRVVVPKEIRVRAGLRPKMQIEVRCRDGRIEIEPVPLPVKIERKGHLLVAKPQGKRERLAAETVERTREALRGERTDHSAR